MTAFWDSWQLWVKMTFVLACAIVVVVGAGCCQLVWMHRNLRKHVRLLQERQAEQAALMARPSVRERKRRSEVPFGVRAIESGVEIEGIWISRPNSTATSLAQTPVLSGATSPRSPPPADDDPSHPPSRRAGAESPVSGATRVLTGSSTGKRHSRPHAGSRTTSDPFRDSRATSSGGGGGGGGNSGMVGTSRSRRGRNSRGSASSGGGDAAAAAPYYDLPDAEAGRAGIRMPTSPSTRSGSRHYASNQGATQPAFYRPTGTPDPFVSKRNSYIPKYLQTRALGDGGGRLTYSPEEQDEHDPAASFAYAESGQASEKGRLLQYGQQSPLETSFVTPAGMMPQVPGSHRPPSGYKRRSDRGSYRSGPPVDELNSPEVGEEQWQRQRQRQRQSTGASSSRHGKKDSHGKRASTKAAAATTTTSTTTATTGYRDDPRANPDLMPTVFASRAEAEAAGSDMRRVNDGFSVSRRGVRHNRESLVAEAQGLRDERERRERQDQRQPEAASTPAGAQDRHTSRNAGTGHDGAGASASTPTTFSRQDSNLSSQQQQQQQQQQQPHRLQKKRASAALAIGPVGASSSSSSPPVSSSSSAARAKRSSRGNAQRGGQFVEQM